jgi:hypothetical protein
MTPDRYTTALNSSNLRLSASIDDATILIAAGYTKAKDAFFGQAITLLIAHDSGHDIAERRADLIGVLYGRMRRLMPCDGSRIALAIDHWMRPACNDCAGLGHKQIAGTPNLEDADCPKCSGSGIRPHSSRSQDYAETLRRLDAAIDWAHRMRDTLPIVQRNKTPILKMLDNA